MTDLECSLCKKSRTSVEKLIAGNSGCICDACLANCVQAKETTAGSKHCFLCENQPGVFGLTDSKAGICKECLRSCKQLVGKIDSGQTWRVGVKRERRSCRPHRSKEERKIFYDSALKQLGKGPITEDTGDLLVELLDIKPSKRLIGYARKWMHQFPNHEDAPRVMSFWLTSFPSRESLNLAAWYLKQHQPLVELHWLILSVFRGKGSPRLDRLVSERLKQSPHEDIWQRCLHPYKARSSITNTLALLWLKLNENNPNLSIMGFTHFADSPEVVNAVFKHFRKHGVSREYNEWEIQSLLHKAREFNMSILPDVIKFARAWLKLHSDHRMASHVHEGLVYASDANSDNERAKQWFLSHKSSPQSFLVLNALMHLRQPDNCKPDTFAIEQAKQLIANMPAEDRPPALIGTLLMVCPDEQTIAWAKETYQRTPLTWILIELVNYSPDAAIIAKAERETIDLVGSSIEHEMFYALLKAKSSDSRVKRLARAWLKKNPRHPWAKAIRDHL